MSTTAKFLSISQSPITPLEPAPRRLLCLRPRLTIAGLATGARASWSVHSDCAEMGEPPTDQAWPCKVAACANAARGWHQPMSRPRREHASF